MVGIKYNKREFFCQCELRKKSNDGELVDIAWIPDKFAHKGKVVNIKKGNIVDDSWIVVKVYDKIEADKVELSERDFLKQRSASDI